MFLINVDVNGHGEGVEFTTLDAAEAYAAKVVREALTSLVPEEWTITVSNEHAQED